MDEASLAQFRAATAPSRRVANLRHVRDCVIKRDADPYLRPAEVMALLEPERLGAIELYAVDDPEPQIRKDRATAHQIERVPPYMDRNSRV